MPVDRTALFVRVPTSLSEQLTERVQVVGRSKQDVVCDLLQAQIDAGPVDGSVPSAAHTSADSDAGTTPTSPSTPTRPDVLDLDGVAALLDIDAGVVLDRLATGDFPGRRFGEHWRFSRSAVMSWLAGNDPVAAPPPTGFSPSRP